MPKCKVPLMCPDDMLSYRNNDMTWNVNIKVCTWNVPTMSTMSYHPKTAVSVRDPLRKQGENKLPRCLVRRPKLIIFKVNFEPAARSPPSFHLPFRLSNDNAAQIHTAELLQ